MVTTNYWTFVGWNNGYKLANIKLQTPTLFWIRLYLYPTLKCNYLTTTLETGSMNLKLTSVVTQ
jgi:hypothetical protein